MKEEICKSLKIKLESVAKRRDLLDILVDQKNGNGYQHLISQTPLNMVVLHIPQLNMHSMLKKLMMMIAMNIKNYLQMILMLKMQKNLVIRNILKKIISNYDPIGMKKELKL